MTETLAIAQGIYFALTGVWALVDVDSFQKVTGPKTDIWLVKTVGVLVLVIGAVIAVAGWRERITPEIVGLAIGSAAGLAGIDVFYALRGRISKIYLLDAAAEAGIILLWVVALATS